MVQNEPAKSVADATRRRFLAVSAAAGLGTTLFPGVLLGLVAAEAAAQGAGGQGSDGDAALPNITDAMIEAAAVLAGVNFTAEQRGMMLENLNSQRDDIAQVRKIALPNGVAPSLVQDPVLPGTKLETQRGPTLGPNQLGPAPRAVEMSASNEEQIAFAGLRHLSVLMQAQKITSVELTKLYLARLKRYDPQLHFVITLTEERALKQAAKADHEMRDDKMRSWLHGIPWGAKDLLAV